MELAFVVYLISILENIAGLLLFITAMCGLLAFFIGFFQILEGEIENKKTLVFLIILTVFFGSLRAMMPSQKQAYIILGAYTTQKVYESDEAKQIGNKILKIVNDKLDGMAEDKEKK